MAIYCWGSTLHGELGLGGIEDEQILVPREMTWSGSSNIVQAACGSMHTLLLNKDGKVYSCGNNDYGQLGHDLSRKRPQLISAFENYLIIQISCGHCHSLAINEWGQLFSWGSNLCSQLGIETVETIQPTPKLVKSLATKQILQIATGQYHCLALTNSGELYAWGSNSYGQLGIGTICEKVAKPALIKSLAGIPIAFITCGGNHSFAISKSGAIYGWGKNNFGQLGLNDLVSKSYPSQLKTLRSLGVRYIACGDDFTVYLTIDGGVFTSGNGTFGQLGHGSCGNEILPRMVVELMGSTISQITCGRRHTLALVPSRGRVYGFGLGGSGQLGTRNTLNSPIPQVVIGPWVSPSGSSLLNKPEEMSNGIIKENVIIKRIFSGGDHCFVSVVEQCKQIPPEDCRLYPQNTQILTLSLDLLKTCSEIEKTSTLDLDFLTSIETIFKSQSCINASFLLENEHICCNSKRNGVNMELAELAFNYLSKTENESLKQLIWDCITIDLIPSLIPSPCDIETLRIYLILPLYHEFVNSKNYLKLHSPFSKALLRLNAIPLKIIKMWWANQTKDYFERLVEIFKNVVCYIIQFQLKKTNDDQRRPIFYEDNLALALNLMMIFFSVNHLQRTQKVPYEVFNIPEITETVDIHNDYLRWIFDNNPNNFYLCNYPFIFDAQAKTELLQTDQAIQMQSAIENATTQGLMMLMTGSPVIISQFVVLNVSRDNLVDDTLREISQYGESDLKKPLKVKFHGEEAEDAGGVRKEFFMLVLRDILDPKYGMFRQFDDSRAIWFSEDSFETEEMYMLIGLICGLAIYNFTIINLSFPLALYKKLLREPVELSDLRDLSPILANSMQSILDYNETDFEETFNLTFDISREVYGETKTILLKPEGDKIPVTLENKTEFVDLYIDFIFNKSVEKHFNGFKHGFMKVCGGKVLELFKPHELMSVVIGNEDYDWHELESEARYKNGYSSGDQTIQWFWEVLHDLPLSEKKNFLLFLTGSDRIPIQGMKAIKIIIQPTNDDKFLPVAHTCFNLLDLPQYKTKERLRYKLIQAIQQTQGFSLV